MEQINSAVFISRRDSKSHMNRIRGISVFRTNQWFWCLRRKHYNNKNYFWKMRKGRLWQQLWSELTKVIALQCTFREM